MPLARSGPVSQAPGTDGIEILAARETVRLSPDRFSEAWPTICLGSKIPIE